MPIVDRFETNRGARFAALCQSKCTGHALKLESREDLSRDNPSNHRIASNCRLLVKQSLQFTGENEASIQSILYLDAYAGQS
jgi:hypothetical protein